MSTKFCKWETPKNNISTELATTSKFINIIVINNDIYIDMVKHNNYSYADRISIQKLTHLIESDNTEKIQSKFVICDDKRSTDPIKYSMLNKLISRYGSFSYNIKNISYKNWNKRSSLKIHNLIIDIMKANAHNLPGSCTIEIVGGSTGSYDNDLMMLNTIYKAACEGYRFKILSWNNSDISNYHNIAKNFNDNRITFSSLDPNYKNIVYSRFITKPVLNPELDSESETISDKKPMPYVDKSWLELESTFKIMNLMKNDKICMCKYYCGGIDCKSITVEWVKSL
jgi:hypothetical protein